jgi:hypothetical protein
MNARRSRGSARRRRPVRVRQALSAAAQGEALLEAALDVRAWPTAWCASPPAHASTARLGAMFGEIVVERA